MFLHIALDQLHGQPITLHMLTYFLPTVLRYNKPNKSKNHRHFSYYLVLQKIKLFLWDFGIKNSVRITEGSDNGNSDNQGSTVLTINNLLADLLIRQTFFRQMLETSQFAKLSPYQTFLLYGNSKFTRPLHFIKYKIIPHHSARICSPLNHYS